MRISAILGGSSERIIMKWKERILGDPEIPQAQRLPEETLTDHMPELLSQITKGLDYLVVSQEVEAHQLRLRRLHECTVAHVKTRLDYGYTMTEIVKEYAHIRGIVTEELLAVGASSQEALYIHAALDYSLGQVSSEMHRREMDLEEKLVAIVSHDLRNPLSAIIFSLQHARRGKLSPEMLDMVLARALRAAKRGLTLTEDLLDFKQLKAGNHLLIKLKICDLRGIVETIVEEQDYQQRKIVVRDDGGNLEGHWDCDRISQLVSNLLSNALKHSPVGSTVEIRQRGREEEVELEIENEGKLPEGNLFEAYRREGGSQGVGLGLYIARHVVLAHRGTLAARGERGRVIFNVTLPRA